ncbi:hypothetical protein IGB42_03453 [Andreprevotia sp. IGB-42]|uniref:tetratricopeptide repeat protein n=1 Tax=Andreprevotia sp. IGB-42 TaxID=2497473 RepID=UPI00135A8F4F|nr:tetratricopeptide repeat protein [Andreprevotia sp. IGB-42]KAF0812175.1 hypothetical protein IGB42_03453 [Andreprevotia sp. IGB-42]
MSDTQQKLASELEPLATAAASGSPESPAVIDALLRRARALNDAQLIGLAYVTLGHAWQHTGSLKNAQQAFRHGAKVFLHANLARAHVEALIEEGRCHYAAGDAARALDTWAKSLEHAHVSHDLYNCARVYLGVGQVYVAFGDHDSALHYHELALKLARPLGEARLECEALINVAGDAYRQLNYSRAEQALAEADALLQGAVSNRVWAAEVHNYRGLILYAQGKDAAAVPFLEAAFRLNNENDNLWGKAHALLALGKVFTRLCDTSSAERDLLGARELARQAQLTSLQQDAVSLLAQIAADRGDHETTLRRYRELHALRSQAFPANPETSLRSSPQAAAQLKLLEARSRLARTRLRFATPGANSPASR